MAQVVRNGRRYKHMDGFKHPITDVRPKQIWVDVQSELKPEAPKKGHKGAVPIKL